MQPQSESSASNASSAVLTYTETLNATPDARSHHESVIAAGMTNMYRAGRALWPEAPERGYDEDEGTGPAEEPATEPYSASGAAPTPSVARIHPVTGSSWIRAISYTPQGVRNASNVSLGILTILTRAGDIIIRYNVPSYHVGLLLAQSHLGQSVGKWYHKHIRTAYPGISKSDGPEYTERINDIRNTFELRLK